ncbi:MAG: hypothetical protein OEO17_11490, partial [Gemmatimonadota bacterium]|nr:hypothetical protein [Gemmatimonadota bacterium]
AIEWILARISPRPLRITWSLLAGFLAAEIAYLLVATHVVEGAPAVVAGVLAAGLTLLLFERTTRRDADTRSSNDSTAPNTADPAHRR